MSGELVGDDLGHLFKASSELLDEAMGEVTLLRRERLAIHVLPLMLGEAQTRCELAGVTDPAVRYAEAAKEAVKAADALIAELDR